MVVRRVVTGFTTGAVAFVVVAFAAAAALSLAPQGRLTSRSVAVLGMPLLAISNEAGNTAVSCGWGIWLAAALAGCANAIAVVLLARRSARSASPA
jgi:hypothetical protein